jgi:hypothetical protein
MKPKWSRSGHGCLYAMPVPFLAGSRAAHFRVPFFLEISCAEECVHWSSHHLTVVTQWSALCLQQMNQSINTVEKSWVRAHDNLWC